MAGGSSIPWEHNYLRKVKKDRTEMKKPSGMPDDLWWTEWPSITPQSSENTTGNEEKDTNCDQLPFDKDLLTHGLAAAALLIVIMLSWIRKRKHMFLTTCGGRPAILYPVNFIDEVDKRWAYTAAFVGMANELMQLFTGDLIFLPEMYKNPEFVMKFGWTKVFVAMLNVFEMTILHYPVFACIAARRHIVANSIGLTYTIAWLTTRIYIHALCPIIDDNGEWDLFEVLHWLGEIPIYVSNILVIFSNAIDLYYNIIKHTSWGDRIKPNQVKESRGIKYVKNLFRQKPYTPTTIKEKVKFMLYTKFPGFKYSCRVICTMACAMVLLFQFLLAAGGFVELGYAILGKMLEPGSDIATALQMWEIYALVVDFVVIARGELYFCAVFSFLVQCASMFHMVLCYRQHMRLIYKGQRFWTNSSSPTSIVVRSLRYSGYQIAYILWAFIVFFLLLFVIMISTTYLIVLPLIHNETNQILELIKQLWPTIVISLVISIVQMLAAKFFFLSHRGKYLALDNRNAFHVLNFFMIAFNILLGLFSCLRRIVLTIVIGLLTVGRLDRSPMMRHWESLDPGFQAYLGMLELDAAHNHPVVRAFIEIIQKEAAATRFQVELSSDKEERLSLRKKWPRNKWRMASFLIWNRSLTIDRMVNLQWAELKEQQEVEAKKQPEFVNHLKVSRDTHNYIDMPV